MRFRRNLTIDRGAGVFIFIPLINLIFIMAVLYSFVGTHLINRGVPVKLPRTLTSDAIAGQNLVITITGEDIMYFNNALCTSADLMSILSKRENRHQPVLIKVDRRASAGRIFDVWNICRKLDIERINIAATRE